MAKTKLSQAAFVKRGYGQVEPNHLSAQRTGQIYAQLPAKSDIEVLENGQFVKYDYQNKEVNFTGKGELLIVFNEFKLYRDYEQYDDFAMIKSNYAARIYSPVGQDTSDVEVIGNMEYPSLTIPAKMPAGTSMVPRVIKINVGDIYTTNTVNEASLAVGDELKVSTTNGYLAKTGDEAGPVFVVVKVYTLADGQPAVKLQRIA